MQSLVEIISGLSRLIVQMEEDAREQFKFNELTITQMNYLETINYLGNPNITELASEMKLTKPTVTVAVDKLLEKEFIQKIHSDEDRRSTHLHLTEKGKLINQMHDYAHRLVAELITQSLSKEETDSLVELLEKVLKNRAELVNG
ncbi:MAG: MarR family transcriptional regulator [Bacteroidetes bacterium]|nr:MarR family transcriptional regulator [Bacteroidota bacterium]